jgi:putative membrane protein
MRWNLAHAGAAALGQYDGQYYGPHMMGGGWWWMWIVWVGGFVVLVLIVYLLVGGLRSGGPPPERLSETPLDILKKRYAKGEITRAEYEQMKKDLEE